MSKTICTLSAVAVIGGVAVAGPFVSRCATGLFTWGGAGVAMGDPGYGEPGDAKPSASPVRAKTGDEVVCAIDGMKMRLTDDTPWAAYRGTAYYFCNEIEKRTFLEHPERFLPK